MKNAEITEFVTAGTPRHVADAIEQHARAHGNVAALVVPWESSGDTLSMAVTSVRTDGWAIEHTNLGTIRLTPDGASTRVTLVSAALEGGGGTLSALFDQFARDVRTRLDTTEAR